MVFLCKNGRRSDDNVIVPDGNETLEFMHPKIDGIVSTLPCLGKAGRTSVRETAGE